METTYVMLGSQLSEIKATFEQNNNEVYRTRVRCACPAGHNTRNGILVINGSQLVAKAMRCKACAKVQEGGNAW